MPSVDMEAVEESAPEQDVPTVLYDLDLTNAHLHSLADVPLPDTLQALDATANRLKTIEEVVLRLPALTKLCLRQNLLTHGAEIESLASAEGLQELDIRDNQYTEIADLSRFHELKILEMSYNQLSSLAPLRKLRGDALTNLCVAANKAASMEGISHLTGLRTLDLGSNRLRCVEGLAGMHGLEELWLGRNRITEMAGLDSLRGLKRLSLQSNRLEKIGGLEGCVALEELYLSHNGLTSLEGVSTLGNLRVLDVASNRLESLEGLGHHPFLTDLWANSNKLVSLEETEGVLVRYANTLSCLYLGGNACAGEAQYRRRLVSLLPKLEQLDDAVLSPT